MKWYWQIKCACWEKRVTQLIIDTDDGNGSLCCALYWGSSLYKQLIVISRSSQKLIAALILHSYLFFPFIHWSLIYKKGNILNYKSNLIHRKFRNRFEKINNPSVFYLYIWKNILLIFVYSFRFYICPLTYFDIFYNGYVILCQI